MHSHIENIVSLLKRTFEKDAWHGPAVLEAVADLSAEQASMKLPNTHSIIELVAHMTAWRIYVAKKLSGNDDYKVSNDMNFPRPENWTETVKQLRDSQRELLAAVAEFPAEKLPAIVPGAPAGTTYYTLLHGIIHHDLYHTGQVCC